jgi:hypothetical protein
MRAFEILIAEGYKEATTEFSQYNPNHMVNDAIARYKDLVNRNQVQGTERNIDFWRKQGWEAFKKFVDTKGSEAGKTQIKRSKVVGKSITLQEDNNWLIVIPLDKNASCFYGKNSSWCTAKLTQSHFENYFYRRDIILIYCLHKQSGKMYAIAGHHQQLDNLELFNQNDDQMTSSAFKQETGLDPTQLINLAISKHQPKISAAKESYVSTVKELTKIIPTISQRNIEVEKKLLQVKDGALVNNYVSQVMPGVSQGSKNMPLDFPQALILPLLSYNPIVLKSIPQQTEQQQLAAVSHPTGARYVINPTPKVIDQSLSAFPESIRFLPSVSYNTIIKYPAAAAAWAAINRKRVPEAEQAIAKDAKALTWYLQLKQGQPWPEAEPTILTNGNLIIKYVKNFLKKPWPAGEKKLIELARQDPKNALNLYMYANDILKKPWAEAESIIVKDPHAAAMYALNVKNKRWPEAEAAMLTVDPHEDDEAAESIEDYFRYFDVDH